MAVLTARPEPLSNSDSRALLSILAKALGVRVRVDKSRRVYLYRGARIHLDRVASLGSFVEFEVQCNDGDENCHQ